MTSPRGPRRRRRPSTRQLEARQRELSKVIAPELAAEMAPFMPLTSRRTKRVIQAMRRKVYEVARRLREEADEEGSRIIREGREFRVHPTFGILDRDTAIYQATEEVTRAFYTGDDADYEPELRALVSP